jgi:hypothetical protein
MCFEALGSSEMSYEVNYQGSESGWERNRDGVSLGTVAEPQPSWIVGKSFFRQTRSKLISCYCIVLSCYNHTIMPYNEENGKRHFSSVSSGNSRSFWKIHQIGCVHRYLWAHPALIKTHISSLCSSKQCGVKPQGNLLSLKLVHIFIQLKCYRTSRTVKYKSKKWRQTVVPMPPVFPLPGDVNYASQLHTENTYIMIKVWYGWRKYSC